MSPTSHIADAIIDRLVSGLIAFARIIVGLIAAMILAPMLTGFLFGLTSWPKAGLGHHVSEAATGALLFLYFGIALSLQAVVYFALPGIIVLRWIDVMSRRICVIGGAIFATYPLTGFVGIIDSPLPIDWQLVGVGLCGGGLAGWIYWWVAERPLHGGTPDAKDR